MYNRVCTNGFITFKTIVFQMFIDPEQLFLRGICCIQVTLMIALCITISILYTSYTDIAATDVPSGWLIVSLHLYTRVLRGISGFAISVSAGLFL